MTKFAQHLTAFLREHLPRERRASVHTCDAYANSFQLLVTFAAPRLCKRSCLLQIEDIDVPVILAFLEHIEGTRGNKARSRNARLAAVKSFFRYLEHRVPAVLDQALRVSCTKRRALWWKTQTSLRAAYSTTGPLPSR
ncbi:site-specific integrase [Mesorhizobium australicum]|uniref:site-specific integrase n=1 Tax=Mesorhizobium australicum TaxID=536018 RepID=UPI00333A404E